MKNIGRLSLSGCSQPAPEYLPYYIACYSAYPFCNFQNGSPIWRAKDKAQKATAFKLVFPLGNCRKFGWECQLSSSHTMNNVTVAKIADILEWVNIGSN